MAFANGAVTFKRFFVRGDLLDRVDQELLDKLADQAIDAKQEATADQTVCGWTTGDHILDTRFDFTKNAVGDGLHFAVRTDTNKPPADLVRSYQRQAEAAMLEASGREFLSKVERREAREQARARAADEARAGAFRRMKQVPVFWDLPRNHVYLGTAASSVADPFMLLFHRTFGRSLVPASAGEVAARWALRSGEGTAFDNCRPAHFINPPAGADPDEPILNPGEGQSRDFLGTEWLTWLWYTAQVESAEIATPQGPSVTVLFERGLQLECAFRLSGTTTITADGPTRLPEAAVALASGKRPVRAGLQVAVRGDAYAFSVRGDGMNFSGLRLPQPEEAPHPRAVFESRLEHLNHLVEAMDGLYAAFLKRRLSNKWPQLLGAMRHWITGLQADEASPAELGVAS